MAPPEAPDETSLTAGLYWQGTPPPPPGGNVAPSSPYVRVQSGLQAEYVFNEGSGSTINGMGGINGTNDPLNLTIADPANVTWLPDGGLQVNTATTISSGGAASKIISAAQTSNELTLEAWVQAATIDQRGPARIISLSQDGLNRNATLGHQYVSADGGYYYVARLRTDDASVNENGLPELRQDERYGTTAVQHVVYTRASDGTETIYVDGLAVQSGTRPGSFTNWADYPLLLANENSNDRPWLGTYYLVAVYSRALTTAEVGHNFSVGYASPPRAPSELTAAPVSASSIVLNWTDNSSNETRFGLQRRNEEGLITDISIPANQTSYTDEGLSANATYSYQLRAVNETTVRYSAFTEAVNATTPAAPLPPTSGRVTQDLALLYTFGEGSGNTVSDGAGNLNLTIADPSQISWLPGGGLTLTGATRLTSGGNATALITAMKASGEITLEAWVQPARTDQNGPARIISISGSSLNRNITLGQDFAGSAYFYAARVRTTDNSTNENGLLNGGNFATDSRYATPAGQHLVYTRSLDGTETLYVDGVVAGSGSRLGDFSNWADYPLLLGNEQGAERPWLGTYHLVAAYPRALSEAEVQQNHAAGYDSSPAPPTAGRVTDQLQADYDFSAGSGSRVNDISGTGSALDLSIADPANVTWLPDGGLQVNAATTISSGGAASKIISAAKASNELTLEAWVQAATIDQRGPARIMSLSQDGLNRNATLGHQYVSSDGGYYYAARLRTDDASVNENGLPELRQDERYATTNVQHVVYTRSSDGSETLYVDGVATTTSTRAGSFADWENYPLLLANENSNDRPWLGTFYRAAVYSKALSVEEVEQNYQAGYNGSSPPPGSVPNLGGQAPTASTVDLTWDDVSGETGYEVLRKQASGTFSPIGTTGADGTSYRDNSVQANITYTYRVVAKDNQRILGQADIGVTTPTASTFVAPTALKITQQTESSLELRWLYEGQTSQIDFVLERKVGEGSFSELIIITDGTTTYTDENLTAATRYAYQVFARGRGDAPERSDYSNQASGATHSSETPDPIGNGNYQAQYNGNIAAIKWNSQGLQAKQEKLYYFRYDAVNRLTDARYAERSTPTTWGKAPGHYSVENIGYDENGNIGSLTRFTGQGGRHAIDQLSYTYNAGNQLRSVSDQTASDLGFTDGNPTGDDYAYDWNGNLSEDKNKHITGIEYNLLNLPEVVTFRKEGQQATLQFLYDATGNKLRKTVTDYEGKVTTTDYIAGMQYTQVDNEPRLLELIHHEEGRVVPKADGSGYAYHYDLRDHLGNTRVTFSSETQTDSYLATMEPELANDEEVLFGNVAESRQLDQLTNSTEPSIPTPDPQYSARLNATQNKVVGPAKSLVVKKDDKVTLSVEAFYFGTDSEDNVGAAAILPYVVGAFTGQGVVDGQALGEAIELGGALLSPALFSNNSAGTSYHSAVPLLLPTIRTENDRVRQAPFDRRVSSGMR